MPVHEAADDRSTTPRSGDKEAQRGPRHYTGVLLTDVLDAVKLKQRDHFDLRTSIVVVTASDGYMAVFSWSELYLIPMGDGVMLVYARDACRWRRMKGRLRSSRCATRSPALGMSNGCGQ